MTRPARILIVGAGLSGAVAARVLAEEHGFSVRLIDARNHLAGNCHTDRDAATGVLVHRYGAHIFHTSREDVWTYVNRHGRFAPYTHRVKASTPRGIFGLPINLLTINQFFGKRFSPAEARKFLLSLGDPSIGEPANFEQQALKFVGRELYENFFHGYTRKQWGCEPSELPATALKRLPVRFDYNDDYFSDRYQGLPIDGYTAMVQSIVAHPGIEISLSTPWQPEMAKTADHVIFTGSLDDYFQHRLGRLGYRTVFWEDQVAEGDFQGNAVMNYTGLSEPFTRIIEHKHFAPWEQHDRTYVSTEFSKSTGPSDNPFYPTRLARDRVMLAEYLKLAANERRTSFLGRLATYRYLDMHEVIGEALDFAPQLAKAIREGGSRPALPAAVVSN